MGLAQNRLHHHARHRHRSWGTAVGGQCKLLISVDRDLLDMVNIANILIVRPGEYWRLISDIGDPLVDLT
jgi:hypothetical protein